MACCLYVITNVVILKNKKMNQIAKRLTYFDSSDFSDAVKKQNTILDPIDLSIGVPEELTPEHIKAAGIEAIRNDKTRYTPANGIPELRNALAQKLLKDNHIQADFEDITIVPGLTTGQLLVYLAILDPGDEIIVFDPYYPPYPHLASTVGAHVVMVSTLPTFQPDLPVLEASITNRTKAIVINSPNNPTGAVYSEDTLRKIAHIAQKHNIIVISDEIYEHFVYEGEHFSIGSIYPNTITMNGFSKEYAMTGWRIGYIHGPSDIIKAINQLQQYIVMSSSSIAQYAALYALNHRVNLTEKYIAKRAMVMNRLKPLDYELHGLQGAFFAFFKSPADLTDIEFSEIASQNSLILVPGRAFSRLHGFVRLSYGADTNTLSKGLEVLEKITRQING